MYEAKVITAGGDGGGGDSLNQAEIIKTNIDIPLNPGTNDNTNFGVVLGNNTLRHITNLENQLKWSVDQQGLPLNIRLIIYKTLLNKLTLYDETRKRQKGEKQQPKIPKKATPSFSSAQTLPATPIVKAKNKNKNI